jgi:uncharacterized protein DUF3618
MAEEPDVIRDDIEMTRARLAHDVDRLADKTSPSRMAQRRWQGTKSKVRGLSERVMGTARDTGGSARDTASTVKDKASNAAGEVADQVRQAPEMLTRQTQGNPIAAGLIAFGAGMLVASLLPATTIERQAGQALREHGSDLVEPVRQPLTESAQQLGSDLGDRAKEAAGAVRDTAKDAAQTTAESTKDSARQAAAEVRPGGTPPR